jgi:hypothetical protein
MLRRASFLLMGLLVLAGCEPSAQEKYDTAVRAYERAESRLDNLRPAYDAAREKAALVVCKEIAGTTPEESAMSALTQLEGLTDQALAGQAGTDEAGTGEAADGQPVAGPGAETRPVGDADAALDQLLAAHQQMQETQAAAMAPIAKVSETMTKIKTPGTPEAKRFEEVLATMPEVRAYQRQEKRVERAKQAVEDAEAALPASNRDEAK